MVYGIGFTTFPILLALIPSNRCSWLLIMAELHWGHWFFRTFVSLPRGICGQSLCVHSSLHVFRRAWSGWFQACWSCCGAAEVQAVAVFLGTMFTERWSICHIWQDLDLKCQRFQPVAGFSSCARHYHSDTGLLLPEEAGWWSYHVAGIH